MAAPEVTLPSLLWRRQQNDSSNHHATESVELARSPTWPAILPSPNSASHATYSQPNLYLQLSQILEWEIWNHNQTRVQMYTEQTHCGELEAEIWRLSQIIGQWQEACTTAHAALDEHRMEHIKLVQELEATATELHSLQQRTAITHELSSGCQEKTLGARARVQTVKSENAEECLCDCAPE